MPVDDFSDECRRVWTALGSLRLGDLDPAALDVALACLSRPSSVHDRLALLGHLAEYWHGPLRPEDGLPAAELEGRLLPLPLRWWYERAGRRREVICWQNRLLDPADLETDASGLAVFYVENQGVYHWATRLEGEDPPIWGRFNEADAPWTEEGMKLSEFLIQACLLEGLWQAPYGASIAWANEATLARVLQPLRPLPIAPWRWPAAPTRLYAGGGVFALACPNGEWQGVQGFSLWVGAKREHPLAYLREIVDERWEWVEF
jgi:hypothetical protein